MLNYILNNTLKIKLTINQVQLNYYKNLFFLVDFHKCHNYSLNTCKKDNSTDFQEKLEYLFTDNFFVDICSAAFI